MEQKKLAIIASRLRCADGICVESEKWIDKYLALGYEVHLICGKLGEPAQSKNCIIPEMDDRHPEVRGLKRILFTASLDKAGKKATQILLDNLSKRIKHPLKKYLVQNKIELVSVENILADASNLPLALALSEIISDLNIPTISRYHHFYWDNDYFTKWKNVDKMMEDLPPRARSVAHVTSTESARDKLLEKRNIRAAVIPQTFNLGKIQAVDDYNRDFRAEFGIKDDQLLFVQPTLIKRRKCIEKSLRLVREINDITKKDNVLMITGPQVYSRGNYFEEIVRKMKKLDVNVIFASDRISFERRFVKKKEKSGDRGKDTEPKDEPTEQKMFSIWDAYVHADMILYPTATASFGNPVIESAAYRKPLVVNNYPNLKEITSKGFSFVVMDQKVTPEIISDTYELLVNPQKRGEMVEKNYGLLKDNLSSDILDDRLVAILNGFERESFMHRITKIIPKRFSNIHIPRPNRMWKRKQTAQVESVKGPSTAPQDSQNHQKANKADVPEIDGNETPSDLRNKKGGYKEPVKNGN